MCEVAAHLTDHVLPPVPARQWVLSVPKRLRPYLLHDVRVAGAVLQIFLRAIRATLRHMSPGAPPRAQLGAGVLNFLLGWLIFAVFAIATLGIAILLSFITRWIINAIMLKLTDALTDALKIDSFGWALGGALLMSILGSIGEVLVRGVL